MLILNVCQNASKENSVPFSHVMKGYHTLKYPLIAAWEYYGFGNKEDVMGLSSPVHYAAFKIDPENILEEFIENMPKENPFNSFGTILNSEKVVEKLILIYKHILADLRTGHLRF